MEEKEKIKRRKCFILLAVLTTGWFFFFLGRSPAAAASASLYLSPTTVSVAAGKTFTLAAYVSSPSQAVNAISGRITASAGLRLNSVSGGGSILTYWTTAPSIAAPNTAVFEGVAFNPGYTGSGGRLMTLSFTALTEGTSTVNFTSGSVLANDGNGTNITGGLGKSTVTITAAPPPSSTPTPLPTPPTPVTVSGPTVITSSTHPDQNAWYANANPVFSWTLPADVSGVASAINESPTTELPQVSQGVVRTKEFTNLPDGVWWFHLRVRVGTEWQPTAHFRVQIDIANPRTLIVGQKYLPHPSAEAQLFIRGTDQLSGVDHYQITIDGSSVVSWRDEAKTGTFTTPLLAPGVHVASIEAVDRAGNARHESLSFTVAPDIITTFSYLLTPTCAFWCLDAQSRITAALVLALLLLVLLLYHRRHSIKKELLVFEEKLGNLEERVGKKASVTKQNVARDVRDLASRWYNFRSRAATKLGSRNSSSRASFRPLASQVEKEILLLETKKVEKGLSPAETKHLKDLLEVLQDLTRLHR